MAQCGKAGGEGYVNCVESSIEPEVIRGQPGGSGEGRMDVYKIENKPEVTVS